jgi:ClpP class serine protease
MMHQDVSKLLDEEGIKITFIQAGKYKTESNPFEPLTDEAREHLQAQVDATYETFVAHVARGRGVAKSVARDGFGQGRMFHASQAADLGLVDRVATMGRVLEELGMGTTAKLSKAQSEQIEGELCAAWDDGEELVFQPIPDISVARQRLRMKIQLDK